MSDNSRLYQISGEQIFEIGAEETVKAVSEKVVVYGITRDNLEKVGNI